MADLTTWFALDNPSIFSLNLIFTNLKKTHGTLKNLKNEDDCCDNLSQLTNSYKDMDGQKFNRAMDRAYKTLDRPDKNWLAFYENQSKIKIINAVFGIIFAIFAIVLTTSNYEVMKKLRSVLMAKASLGGNVYNFISQAWGGNEDVSTLMMVSTYVLPVGHTVLGIWTERVSEEGQLQNLRRPSNQQSKDLLRIFQTVLFAAGGVITAKTSALNKASMVLSSILAQGLNVVVANFPQLKDIQNGYEENVRLLKKAGEREDLLLKNAGEAEDLSENQK